MSSRKTKLLESAQKNLLKGQYDRAVEDYRQLMQLEPSDLRHRQKVAEILTKANQKDEAIKEYTFIAKHYIDTTHYLKAIAVYKQVQKLDPNNPEISLTLASLNEKQGLIGNATSEYASAIQIYESNGENLKALKALESMIVLDPGNCAVRLRIAEKYFTTGADDKSFEAFTSLLQDLRDDENGFSLIAERMIARFGAKAESFIKQLDGSESIESPVHEVPPPVETPRQQTTIPKVSETPPIEAVSQVLEIVEQLPLDSEETAPLEEMDFIEDIQPLEDDNLDQDDSEPADDWEEVELPLYDFSQAPDDLADELHPAGQDEAIELDELELVLEIDEEVMEISPLDEHVSGPIESFDLGKELSVFADEIDFDLLTKQASDTVFDITNSGFTKSELDKEDAESHYSLGLAYKEMGLFDEAIGEFIVASRSSGRKIDSLILQGVCLREIGNISKATEILSDLLHDRSITEDETLGINYELALCHEVSGEVDKAKDLLAKIAVVRPQFSDVASRLKSLAH